eukprot:SAG22_NODE_913_length_6527_cov_2.919726_10_plen_60_part_00
MTVPTGQIKPVLTVRFPGPPAALPAGDYLVNCGLSHCLSVVLPLSFYLRQRLSLRSCQR